MVTPHAISYANLRQLITFETRGSHSGAAENSGILGCDAVSVD